MRTVDSGFYDRADAHIELSNSQITPQVERGKVSASFMFSVARFNAWISACGFSSSEGMKNSKQKMVDYFMKEYKSMLEENLDDYINNFNSHMNIPAKKS